MRMVLFVVFSPLMLIVDVIYCMLYNLNTAKIHPDSRKLDDVELGYLICF
jgi:hypothetical protein